jgi:hypothetical protein
MTPEEKTQQPEEKPESNSHWILWTLICIFVVASIGIMLAADYYYAPDTTKAAGAAGN